MRHDGEHGRGPLGILSCPFSGNTTTRRYLAGTWCHGRCPVERMPREALSRGQAHTLPRKRTDCSDPLGKPVGEGLGETDQRCCRISYGDLGCCLPRGVHPLTALLAQNTRRKASFVEGNEHRTGTRLHALTPRYRAPWSAEPRTRVRGSVRPHRGRRPPPSHSVTAAQIDEHDPERERRTWHAGSGE
jgi:hypothetical protein